MIFRLSAPMTNSWIFLTILSGSLLASVMRGHFIVGFLLTFYRRANRQDFLGSTRSKAKGMSAELQALDKPRVVDFNIFKTEYWSCLSGIAPSGCSPELLFAEIMGVIKGSATSASTLMALTRVEYVSKTSKVSPAFASEVEREKVYQSFERYERQKKQRNQVDELDRVIDLLKLLKGNVSLESLIRQCFEEVYVDGIYLGSHFETQE